MCDFWCAVSDAALQNVKSNTFVFFFIGSASSLTLDFSVSTYEGRASFTRRGGSQGWRKREGEIYSKAKRGRKREPRRINLVLYSLVCFQWIYFSISEKDRLHDSYYKECSTILVNDQHVLLLSIPQKTTHLEFLTPRAYVRGVSWHDRRVLRRALPRSTKSLVEYTYDISHHSRSGRSTEKGPWEN